MEGLWPVDDLEKQRLVQAVRVGVKAVVREPFCWKSCVGVALVGKNVGTRYVLWVLCIF